MRKSKFFRLLAVLLTLAALMTLSAFAEEPEETAAPVETAAEAAASEEGIEPHAGGTCNGNHTWVSANTSTQQYNSSEHWTLVYLQKRCSVCGVTEALGTTTTNRASHTLQEYLTGHEHLRGTTHAAYYEVSCTGCGYSTTRTRTYYCPGNGNCIYP